MRLRFIVFAALTLMMSFSGLTANELADSNSKFPETCWFSTNEKVNFSDDYYVLITGLWQEVPLHQLFPDVPKEKVDAFISVLEDKGWGQMYNRLFDRGNKDVVDDYKRFLTRCLMNLSGYFKVSEPAGLVKEKLQHLEAASFWPEFKKLMNCQLHHCYGVKLFEFLGAMATIDVQSLDKFYKIYNLKSELPNIIEKLDFYKKYSDKPDVINILKNGNKEISERAIDTICHDLLPLLAEGVESRKRAAIVLGLSFMSQSILDLKEQDCAFSNSEKIDSLKGLFPAIETIKPSALSDSYAAIIEGMKECDVDKIPLIAKWMNVYT